MPVFDQIEVFLDGTYSKDEQKSFIFKSRCICNYLERALDEKQFETTLSRINIHCSKEETEIKVLPLKGAPFLEVRLKYYVPTLFELEEAPLQRLYTQIIDSGVKAAEAFMPVPHGYCMNVLRRFEEEGFKNEWIQSEKSWKKWSIRSKVIARLTTESFTLLQLVYRDGELVAEKQLAKTKPREMLFIEYLGSLSLDRSENVVYKRKGKILSKFNLRS